MCCPLCSDFKYRFPDVEVCSSCGLGRTIGQTVPIDSQNYVDNKKPGGQLRPWYFEWLYRRYFKDLPRGRSLDIGCGQGEFVHLLNKKGWLAKGIDSFNQFSADEKIFFQSQLVDFNPPEHFDFVTMVHSLEHMADPIAALANIKRLLDIRGYVLIIVPNFDGVWSRLTGADWDMLNTQDHIYHYTQRSLYRILSDNGFSVLSTITYSRYAPSHWQIILGQRQFYEKGWGSVQPFRSLIFRANHLITPILNKYVDLRKDGAEIQLLAVRHTG